MIGEDKLIKFSGVAKGEACTIVLRGASSHVLGEAERSLHDALCVLVSTVKDSRVVLGGGCPEMIMSKAVDELAAKTPGNARSRWRVSRRRFAPSRQSSAKTRVSTRPRS